MMAETRKPLNGYQRIVIKIGSALLVDRMTGLRLNWLASLCHDIACLKKDGVEVLVVSSGAIALGRTLADLPRRSLKLEESQACAAIGQIELAKAYRDSLSTYAIATGQILLTLSDTEDRRRFLNARATIETLLGLGVVPVINENDTVATSEIRYGDNDRLAARVATMMNSDLLILLSDVDGLYTAPPHDHPDARFLPFIEEITPDIEALAGPAASELSRGGMQTKLLAGKIATRAGTAMIITSGVRPHPLSAIDNGERSSFFAPSRNPVNAWKSWIFGHLEPAGILFVDQGAVEALLKGRSLLPAGIKKVEGHFRRGDTVAIYDCQEKEIARGLVAYNADEARLIAGHKSTEIEKILGHEARGAMIHRNNMVVRS